ncbi:hypothetical protein [uncultured Maribacter sp.]|uniref:hypothetical protein n=1 Tax=uncultured Maribacter sp. TaxID=431308 RepID=UPI00261F736B|nr:hypothetical protein [uncultured Maribacter sp.]
MSVSSAWQVHALYLALLEYILMGFGETKLTNEYSNEVICSKEKHQANRRSEFIIVK